MKHRYCFVIGCMAVLFAVLSLPAKAQTLIDKADELGITAIVNTPGSGSGLSTFDFNQDGLDDITMTNSYGDILCYQNNGTDFTLQDFGLTVPGLGIMTLWVDYNNDGELDMFIATYQGQLILYRNNGNFNFEEVTAEAGLPTYSADYFGCSFADYDLDGDLDLYTGTYTSVFNDPLNPIHINHLYRNEGNGTFVDVTESSLILAPATLTFQPTWLDYNLDGWPDLYVINDRFPPNFFFKNNGDGTFEEIAEEIQMDFPHHEVMTNSVCDFDFDGDLDIFMTNSGIEINEYHNLLAVNQEGGEYFQERAEQYGINTYVPGWGGVWFDLDNDTSEDLLFVTENEWPIYLFKNLMGQGFEQINDSVVVSSDRPSYCAAKGDFDNDGYADIAIQCRIPNPSYVLLNTGGTNNFIKVTPRGTISNIHAIGSWVKVFVDDNTYSQYTHCGENYLGQNSQHLIFGLGEYATVDSIQVIYPSRHIDTYYNVSAGVSITVTEGETYTTNISTDNGTSFCTGDSILLSADSHPSYLWSNGDTLQSVWAVTDGNYSVIVQNDYGIIAYDTITVVVNPLPSISSLLTMPLCNGDSTGAIELINQTQIDPTTVIWSHGATGDIIDSLQSGEYFYTYEDVNGCFSTGFVSLIDPPAMQFFATSTPENDGGSDGSISITIFGGTPPFQIFLALQLVTSPISDLEGGEYVFSVFDSNLCQKELTVIVDEILDIQSNSADKIKIYPNPVFDQLHITGENDLKALEIISIDGKVLNKFTPNAMNTYNIETLSTGLYFLRIIFDDGTIGLYRLSKK